MSRGRAWLQSAAISAALLLPGAYFVGIPLAWDASGLTAPTGDEPHYLIAADALIVDHSVRVDAAYRRDALERKIAGPFDSENHSRTGPHGTFSVHGAGLPALIAPAFAVSGLRGARLTMSLAAALVPFLFYAIARTIAIGRATSLTIALCSAFGLPFLAASGQIYPDLPSGVLYLALSWALAAAYRGIFVRRSLIVATASLIILPWLHVKNTIAVLVIMSGLLWITRRFGSGPRIALAGAVTGSIALLAAFHVYGFGTLAGPYAAGAASATFRQALMIALGLHIDQAQGIFVQQPLFLLGVVGLPLLLRSKPAVGWTLTGAYLAVLIPNAFHPCWYGCASLSGRFMWSLAPLWFLPLAEMVGSLGRIERRAAAVIGAAAVLWQVSLMTGWRANPQSLYFRMFGSLAERNSLVSLPWRRFLPSLYDFDDYLRRPSNALAVTLLTILVLIGLWWARSHARARRFATIGPLAPVLLAVGLVASAAAVVHTSTAASIDLLQTFAQADLRPKSAPAEALGLTEETIGGQTRRSIAARAPSRITWQVAVPRDAVLEVLVGVDPEAWAIEGDGVLFRIGVGGDDGYREWASRLVDARHVVTDRVWIPLTADLSRYAGQTVSIIFGTNFGLPGSTDARGDLSYWAEPRIRTY